MEVNNELHVHFVSFLGQNEFDPLILTWHEIPRKYRYKLVSTIWSCSEGRKKYQIP
jgi:hypothetical protein